MKNTSGRYFESEFEEAFLSLLEKQGYILVFGDDIIRKSQREVIYTDDLLQFLLKNYPDLKKKRLEDFCDKIRFVGGTSDFAILHKVHDLLTQGLPYTKKDGTPSSLYYLDFENPQNNIFRAVNQFSVEYTDNGKTKTRRPDILLFVNGIPLCLIELKNPTKEKATLEEAWKQIYVRYWGDIPHLLHYCPLACISDGAEGTKLGTVKTPFEHFYSWRRVNEDDKPSVAPFDQLENLIEGVFAPKRFLEIFRDYIYFQDETYDKEEKEIVCRYPQFFATRLLKKSIVKAIQQKTGKGGTYFGATGCGKTYVMAFLARQLSLRSSGMKGIGSPTIVVIVDRDDLQKQGAKLFSKSNDFLGLGSNENTMIIRNRMHLRQELKARGSGGFYICTIQKFCDKKEDKIGLINERQNIICFSDEAHRTQTYRENKIRFTQDERKNMQAVVSKPYAVVLREAFPNATFVGFTGTPVSDTYATFGAEIDRYTMDQSVQDGITVQIKYHPRITKVLLDQNKAKQIEDYYKICAKEGSTKEQIEKSKKAMSSMQIIIAEPARQRRLAVDIHNHYTNSLNCDPQRVQKAFVVCSSRKIAYCLLKIFQEEYPQWFEEKKVRDGLKVTEKEEKELKPTPFMAMVASTAKDDTNDERKEMYEYLGGAANDKRNEDLDAAFKNDKSNFSIAIVVDMWITGFDAPSLTYLYNDKPLQNHTLIQTISRVNRKYPQKEYGMIIDYIGIRDNMLEALKIYGGENSVATTADDVEQAKKIFTEHLEMMKGLFAGFDLTAFLNDNLDSVQRYKCLSNAAEYVLQGTKELSTQENGGKTVKKVSFRTYFLQMAKRLRAAFDICSPAGELKKEETSLARCFLAIAGLLHKMIGTSVLSATGMNKKVEQMVEEALKYNKVESLLEIGEEDELFSPEFAQRLCDMKLPATKLELLVKMLKKQIAEYGKTNQLSAKKFRDMLEKTIETYHERRKNLSMQEAGTTQEEVSQKIIEDATQQALGILQDMKKDKESFRTLGLTFEEKAFYDILLDTRDKYNFEYGKDKIVQGVKMNDKCRVLSQKIKEIIDTKSSFSDWLNNQNVRDQLKYDIKLCLVKMATLHNIALMCFSR